MRSFANSMVIKNHLVAFAQHYLPGGVRKGREWVVGDVQGNKGTSMNFCLEGEKAGLWIDNATRETGNPVSLVMKQKGCTREEAIEEIEDLFNLPKVPEFKPRAPVKHAATAEHHFFFVAQDGTTPLMAVQRYEYVNEDGEVTKESRPYVLSPDYKAWTPGAPTQNRPLYRLDKLRPRTKVIIVEGEKKADYLARIVYDSGFDVVAWPMGASQAHLVDWMPLYGRKDIIIWPDNDEAGKKAADAIKGILHGASIIPVPEGKPQGWDCADASEDEIRRILQPQEDLPFQMLGSEDGYYFYYVPKTLETYALGASDLSTNVLLYLAPRDWWISRFPVVTKKEVTIHTDKAKDWINREQQAIGKLSTRSIHGCGMDIVDGKVMVNCGPKVYLDDEQTFDRITDEYIIRADGRIADPYEGEPEFDYQQIIDAVREFDVDKPHVLLGWLCLAPLCGILEWRPHIWLTGMRGSGKSTFLEKVFAQALGNWSLKASGTATTEPGLRRLIQTSALPVLFDEAESDTQSDLWQSNIKKILTLATVASSKGTAQVVKGTNKKAEIFKIQNMFCFACTEPPVLKSAEYTRITEVTFSRKRATKKLSINFNGNFIARQIKERDRILAVVEEAKEIMRRDFPDGRFVDQYASLYGAALYMESNGMITLEELAAELRERFYAELNNLHSNQEEDSNDALKLIRMLMSAQIKEGSYTYTVGEMITRLDKDPYLKETLARWGMRIMDGHLLLTPNNDALNNLCKRLHSESWFKVLVSNKDVVDYDPSARNSIGSLRATRFCRIPLETLGLTAFGGNVSYIDRGASKTYNY